MGIEIEVAYVRILKDNDPTPPGIVFTLPNKKDRRIITYIALSKFLSINADMRQAIMNELNEMLEIHFFLRSMTNMRSKPYYTRSEVEQALQIAPTPATNKLPVIPTAPMVPAKKPQVVPIVKKPVVNVFPPPLSPKPISPGISKNSIFFPPIKPTTTPSPGPKNKLSKDRIPTDVCIHWIDILNKNYNSSNGPNKAVLLSVLKARKLQWMTHNLTVEAMKKALIEDSETLQKAGLYQLAGIAYSETNDCLYNHLPIKNDYESIKHLLADNMYGAAFESFWIDSLVERRNSKNLFQTMQKVGQGLSKMLKEDFADFEKRRFFIDRLTSEIIGNPRFWNHKATSLEKVKTAYTYDDAWEEFHTVLNQTINDGYNVILIPSLIIMIFISYRQTLEAFKITPRPMWLEATQNNYTNILDDYQKANGHRGLYNKLSSHVITSGITQIHHPPTNPKKLPDSIINQEKMKFRWSLDRKPNLSGGFSRTLLEHGIPYAGGVSGSCNIIAGTLVHLIKDFHMPIDAKEAMLATMMFVVYEGGHSMHEILWTLYERELQSNSHLSLNLKLIPQGQQGPLRGLFVSDYEYFIKMFQGSETGLALSNARNDAWQKTLEYFNTHSPYKNLFIRRAAPRGGLIS